MHRIMAVPQPMIARVSLKSGRLAGRAAGACLVLAVLLTLLPARAQAQPGPGAGSVIISVNGNEPRKMSTGKNIAKVQISDETKLRIVPRFADEVFLVGVSPG